MTSMSAPRPVLASGKRAWNSADTEAVRRFLQGRLPNGIHAAIALECGKTRDRVDEEIEGTKPLSYDVVRLAVAALPLEHRLHLGAHLVDPWGLAVYATSEGALS